MKPNIETHLQSQVISFLRFPLIVAVVFIHTQITAIGGIKANLSAPFQFTGQFQIYETTVFLVAQIFARLAVPLFFIFSGFLFFKKCDEFNTSTYFNKLKKRTHSLLIPYLFWNLLFIVLFSQFADSIKDWLILFWRPASLQLWFIRDLMVVVLFSPLIYWLTKKTKHYFPLTLCILWLMQWWFKIKGISIEAFFFFSLGGYFSITKKNFVELVKNKLSVLTMLYFILVLATLLLRNCEYVLYIRRLSIVAGVPFIVSLTANCIERKKWKVNSFLEESSFFIYAYHIIAMRTLEGIFFSILPTTTEIKATILYFLFSFLLVLIGLGLYALLKRFLPKTTAFITGGR